APARSRPTLDRPDRGSHRQRGPRRRDARTLGRSRPLPHQARRARYAHSRARESKRDAWRPSRGAVVMPKLRVLVVDDDVQHLDLVRRSLRAFGIDVETSDSSLGVSAIIRRTEPDLVLLDVNIPALPGDALLGLARR